MAQDDHQDGMICGYMLDGKGGGRPVGWEEAEAWRPGGDGLLWLHLDRAEPRVAHYLDGAAGIDNPAFAEALRAAEIRPRVLREGERLLVFLRGINLTPGADREDMIAIRMLFEPGRILTLRHRPLMAVRDLRAEVARGEGPKDPGEFLVRVTGLLLDRIAPVIEDLDEKVDGCEAEMLTARTGTLRPLLADIRGETIELRRYLAPQRDAMARLMTEPSPFIDDLGRAYLREYSDRMTRYVEELDSIRERAVVVHEELNYRQNEQMNRTIFILTVVAGVLLPPSLLTGLLGINVGGMPGADSATAFWFVVGGIVAMIALEIWLFTRLRWLAPVREDAGD